jgi:hypothetical protein
MWDEIADMPGEIFDITEWKEIEAENEEPGWDLFGFDDQSN